MTEPVTVAEAKLFLRVGHEAEDGLIETLLAAARARLEAELGLALDAGSPAPLRLAVLQLAAHAYEHRGQAAAPAEMVEPWLRPYRTARL